ncbi:hypothetical protein PIB30_056037 [Stylosanthes scabra]|uniref:Uncharacterized protein n=1 Tax=Stylosanthes scabra TaxID=79078 RepID=A0ABU6WL01_9FABA|nr:hypothetical protein [Stylosanthes scabra]
MNFSNDPSKRKGPITRSLALKPRENPSRGNLDLESRIMHQEIDDKEFKITKGVTAKKKPGRKPKSSTGYAEAASNMKLEFVDVEAEAEEETIIHKDGVGSPFTYNSHNTYHNGMEMPWVSVQNGLCHCLIELYIYICRGNYDFIKMMDTCLVFPRAVPKSHMKAPWEYAFLWK